MNTEERYKMVKEEYVSRYKCNGAMCDRKVACKWYYTEARTSYEVIRGVQNCTIYAPTNKKREW